MNEKEKWEKEKRENEIIINLILSTVLITSVVLLILGIAVLVDTAVSKDQVKTITIKRIGLDGGALGIVDMEGNLYQASDIRVTTYLEQNSTYTVEVEYYPYTNAVRFFAEPWTPTITKIVDPLYQVTSDTSSDTSAAVAASAAAIAAAA
jgi:hypothetical protein